MAMKVISGEGSIRWLVETEDGERLFRREAAALRFERRLKMKKDKVKWKKFEEV